MLACVLETDTAAGETGLAVKLNAVALKSFTEDGIDDLIGFAHAGGMMLTLIETMPLGEIGADGTVSSCRSPRCVAGSSSRWTVVDLAGEPAGHSATSA